MVGWNNAATRDLLLVSPRKTTGLARARWMPRPRVAVCKLWMYTLAPLQRLQSNRLQAEYSCEPHNRFGDVILLLRKQCAEHLPFWLPGPSLVLVGPRPVFGYTGTKHSEPNGWCCKKRSRVWKHHCKSCSPQFCIFSVIHESWCTRSKEIRTMTKLRNGSLVLHLQTLYAP